MNQVPIECSPITMTLLKLFTFNLLIASSGALVTRHFPSKSTSQSSLYVTRPAVASRPISKEVLDLYNSQVTKELEASQLYLAASIWCEHQDFGGMAKFMRSESEDERGHALSMIDFANKRDFALKLGGVGAPLAEWTTPEEMWQDLLFAEIENTQSLLDLADTASESHDHALTTFLMPFHMEQVNSEDSLRSILAKVQDENKTPGLLRQLDVELGDAATAS